MNTVTEFPEVIRRKVSRAAARLSATELVEASECFNELVSSLTADTHTRAAFRDAFQDLWLRKEALPADYSRHRAKVIDQLRATMTNEQAHEAIAVLDAIHETIAEFIAFLDTQLRDQLAANARRSADAPAR